MASLLEDIQEFMEQEGWHTHRLIPHIEEQIMFQQSVKEQAYLEVAADLREKANQHFQQEHDETATALRRLAIGYELRAKDEQKGTK